MAKPMTRSRPVLWVIRTDTGLFITSDLRSIPSSVRAALRRGAMTVRIPGANSKPVRQVLHSNAIALSRLKLGVLIPITSHLIDPVVAAIG